MTDLAQRLRCKADDLYRTNGEAMKMWDQIRAGIEANRGDEPRRTFEFFLEELADLLLAGADALDAAPSPS